VKKERGNLILMSKNNDLRCGDYRKGKGKGVDACSSSKNGTVVRFPSGEKGKDSYLTCVGKFSLNVNEGSSDPQFRH